MEVFQSLSGLTHTDNLTLRARGWCREAKLASLNQGISAAIDNMIFSGSMTSLNKQPLHITSLKLFNFYVEQ